MKRSRAMILAAVMAVSLAQWSVTAVAANEPVRGAAVFLPATDGARLELAMAQPGTAAVQVLATTPETLTATRKALQPAAGIASSLLIKDAGTLPYPDHLLAYLRVDLDALAKSGTTAPTREEMLRVVAPEGRLEIVQKGRTESVVKPMPKEMGTWPMPHGNAQNNAVSPDELVGPTNTLKFIDSYARYGYHMAQAGLPVIGEGAMLHDNSWRDNVTRVAKHRLICRDAFSGVMRWQVPVQEHAKWMLIAGGKAFTSARVEKGVAFGISAFDLVTGKPVGNIPLTMEKNRNNEVNAIADAAGKTLFVAVGPELMAYNLSDFSQRWKYTSPHNTVFSPTLSTDGKTLTIVENAGKRDGGRWPAVKVAAITAVDPETGKVRWQNTDVNGTITSFTPTAGDRLFYYCTSGILTMTHEGVSKEDQKKNDRFFGVIDLKTGKRLWQKNWKDADGTGAMVTQVGLIRNNLAWITNPDSALGYDLDTGERKAQLRALVVNQRCVRTKATEKYFLMGFGIFLGDGTYTDQNISRSACATGSTPAYGAVYQTADACGCFAQVRGFAAFAAQKPFATLTAEQKLEKFAPLTAKQEAMPVRPPAKTPTILVPFTRTKPEEGYTIRVPVLTDKPVLDSAINNDVLPYPETAPVQLDAARTLVSVVNEHRLECRKGETVLWSYTADARITGDALVHEGRVYVASHDGTVMCIDAETGSPQWRHLVAPARRFVVAYGQFESAWPVPNVIVHEGLICAAAGRHPELDGGIYLAGLDPKTGTATWTGRIHKDTATEKISTEDKRPPEQRHVNRITNGGLGIAEGKLQLLSGDVSVGLPRKPILAIDPANPPK